MTARAPTVSMARRYRLTRLVTPPRRVLSPDVLNPLTPSAIFGTLGLEPWAPLSDWLQFRAELDLPLADGGDCSDGFCRELVQDCKREADAEIARLRGEELSR
jgi:hypothetical protein